MKAKQENEAEIALDVRAATRARAEAEHAERHQLLKEREKDEKETQKFRRQKRAVYYYKVSYLFLTASGIGGGLTSLYSNNEINWITVLLGILMAATFAVLADQTLKHNRL